MSEYEPSRQDGPEPEQLDERLPPQAPADWPEHEGSDRLMSDDVLERIDDERRRRRGE